jgi:GNAT superfamily N-acetyltransferase
MTREFVSLSSEDPDPSVACDRGVSLVPAVERRLHSPDCSLLLIDRGSLTARCSCWWTRTALHDGRHLGVIGHYAATDAGSSDMLLSQACELLASKGTATAVGPMDGNTWRRYRLIVDRGVEPPFFLEPDNPDEWPGHWTRAGFAPLATYTSALNDDLRFEDPRTAAALDRLRGAGITLRTFDTERTDVELQRIFKLSLAAFSGNFLYTPITEREFVAQYHAVLPYVRSELVLLADKGEALVGFMFALPDLHQARRGRTIDTVILKTIAVDPDVGRMGLGGVLMDLVQRKAFGLGFRRAIHALIHTTNVSRKISDRSARTIRRYALFSKQLTSRVA